MALSTVTAGNTILASDINQLVNLLLSPGGNTEVQTGILAIQGAYQTSATVGTWIKSTSQGTSLVSVALSSTTLTGVGSISTSNLSISGANLNAAALGASNTARFVTTATLQY